MKYILGSGISSIILKLYDKNNDYKIIGDNIGGQFNLKFQIGPRILKSNKFSDDFIKEFLPYKDKRIFRVGYYYNGSMNNSCNEDNRISYFKKTRGDNKEFDNSSMNDNNDTFEGYDIDNNDIYYLYDKIEKYFIKDKIEKINTYNKEIICSNNIFLYNNCINTISSNIFYKLCGIDYNINYKNILFYKVRKDQFDFNFDFDFVYFTDNEYNFHRLTPIDDNFYCLEIMENKDIDIKYEDYFILKNGHLSDDNIKNYDFKDIIQCGRYSQNSHNIRMHDVIKFSMELFDK